jgi:hypothetical protein
MVKNETQNKKNNNDEFTDEEFDTVEDSFPEPWKDMDKGDFIIGRYLGSAEINGSNDNPFTIYKLKNDADELISVSGASLEARMVTIPIGARLKVTFTGTEKTKKGSNMKLFTVQVAKNTKLLEV